MGENFLRNSQEFLETMSFMQFLEKSVKLGTKSLVFLRNFRRNIPEKFSGIFWGKIHEKFSGIPRDYVFYVVPRKIRKIRDQVLSISQEFPKKYSGEILRNFLGKIPEKFSGISRN